MLSLFSKQINFRMSTYRLHPKKGETYFMTFTCHKWLPLIEQTNLYTYFEKWFEYLHQNHAHLLGYVIMPNHVHLLIYQDEKSPKVLNTLVSNGKRFLAYEIIKRLSENNRNNILYFLRKDVALNDKKKGKKHQVFRPSFDAKLCFNLRMLETKLHYIHKNPVSGKWRLADDWSQYPYSSAGFYELNQENDFLTHYKDIW